MSKVRVTIPISVSVSFESYESETKNKRAEKQIVRWISDVLRNEVGQIPLYVDKESGSYIEDYARMVK